MMAKALLADRSYWSKFMVLVSMILVFTILMSAIGFLIGYFGFGIDIRIPNALGDISDPNVVALLKTLQILTQFGMFIIPSLMMAWLVGGSILEWFTLNENPGGIAILTCILIMLCSIPFVNWLVQINESMTLPGAFAGLESYLRDMEDSAADLTEAFLGVITVKGLIINLIMVAIIPAIGEEILFRGIVQRWLGAWIGNIHVSIVITAMIFSAVHFQFFGFIPRTLFGILFGYMFYWSGSLWLPIIAHLVNNSTAVMLAYIENTATLPFDQDEIGTGENDIFLLIGSMLIAIMMVIFLRRNVLSLNRKVREAND